MMTTIRRALFLLGSPASYWRGSTSRNSIPPNAILTEDGDPILTEFGQSIEIET